MTPQDKLFFKIIGYGLMIGFLVWFVLVRTEEVAAIIDAIIP